MKFVRHFQSEQNAAQPGILDSGNPDLSFTGQLQGLELRTAVSAWGVRRVVASPALRAEKSGRIAVAGLAVPVYTDSRLREIDWGMDAGRPVKEVFGGIIDTSGPAKGLDIQPNPSAESSVQAAERELRAVEDWADEETLFVGHKLALQSMVAYCLGWDRKQMLDFKIANGQVFEFNPQNPMPPQTVFRPGIGGSVQPSSSAIRL